MHVGYARVDGVEQYFLDVANHRRIVDFAAVVLGRLAVVGLEIEVDVVADIERGQRFVVALGDRRNSARELFIFDNDRLGNQAGFEAKFFQRLQIGRIGNRDEQTIAAFVQRQGSTCRNELNVNPFLIDGRGVKRRQVKQRHTESVRCKFGELGGRDPLRCDQLLDESHRGRIGLCLCLFCFHLAQQLVLDQRTTQTG